MNKKLKTRIIAVTSALALSASLFAAFGSSFNFENIMRAKSSNTVVENGTITFSGSKTTRSSARFTTESSTQTGSYIKCVSNLNEASMSGNYVATLKSHTTIGFYDSNDNEFEFQDLKAFTFVKTNYDTFTYKLTYVKNGLSVTTSTLTRMQSGSYTINLASEFGSGTYSKISLVCDSAASNTAFSSITLTYDCAPVSVLTGISITTPPTKTSYVAGELFDPTGMVVTGSYEDGIDRIITNYTYSPSGALTASDVSVIISYGGFDASQSISVESSQQLSGVYRYNYSSTSYYEIDFDNLKYHRHWSASEYYYAFTIVSQDATSYTLAKGSGNPGSLSDFGSYRPFTSSSSTNSTGVIVSSTQVQLTVYDYSGNGTVITFTKQA